MSKCLPSCLPVHQRNIQCASPDALHPTEMASLAHPLWTSSTAQSPFGLRFTSTTSTGPSLQLIQILTGKRTVGPGPLARRTSRRRYPPHRRDRTCDQLLGDLNDFVNMVSCTHARCPDAECFKASKSLCISTIMRSTSATKLSPFSFARLMILSSMSTILRTSPVRS